MRFGSPDYRAVSGVMRSTFVKTVNLDLSESCGLFAAPTLLIWGEKDAGDTDCRWAQDGTTDQGVPAHCRLPVRVTSATWTARRS